MSGSRNKKGFIYLPNNKQLGILLYLSVLILGIASSLVEPIIAAILRDIGFKVATTTLLTSTFGLITILGSFFLSASPGSPKLLVEALS